MGKGMIILNLKAYSEGMGENAVKLSQIAKEVSESSGVRVILAAQTADLTNTSKIIETYAQHIDPVKPGSKTGSQLADSAKEAGATGSLINHSEHRLTAEEVQSAVSRLRELGMASVVCTQDPEESKKYAEFNPDFIAIEPPELIGSGISVSTANPKIVTDTVEKIREVNDKVRILCGAGISNGADIKSAMELGVEGVLLASAFVKAEDPKAVLEDMVGGFL